MKDGAVLKYKVASRRKHFYF